MAQFFTTVQTNFNSFDLYAAMIAQPYAYEFFDFYDDTDFVADATNFPGFVGMLALPDLGEFSSNYPGTNEYMSWFTFAGTDIVLDREGLGISGTLSGLFSVDPDGYSFLFGGSVSMLSFDAAALTQSTADDLALLRQWLSGDDTLTGSAFADNMFGANGNDTIYGNEGNDTLIGNDGDDQISGGLGADTVAGGQGNDLLNGNEGQDSLVGSAGDDTLIGGAGNDTMHGGTGSDRLTGNIGTDYMYAGLDSVRDVFVFRGVDNSTVGATRDVIYEFVAGTDDINLTLIDANSTLVNDQGFSFSGTTAQANSVWYALTRSGTDLIVFADVDGDAIRDFSVQLVGVTSLSASDFLL